MEEGRTEVPFRSLVRADIERNGISTARACLRSVVGLSPFWLVMTYRVAHEARRRGVPLVPLLLKTVGQLLWGAEIWPEASFGPGLTIAHPHGIVVGSGVRAGANCTLFSGVVLGSSSHHMRDGTCEPTLGDDVTIYSHAVLVGGSRVADGVTITAGSIVSDDRAS
jgi:serine O-acetyltransferase